MNDGACCWCVCVAGTTPSSHMHTHTRARPRNKQTPGPEEWRRIREDKKAKKRRRDVEWLLKD